MNEKDFFLRALKNFAGTLANKISQGDAWTIRGFVDIFKNVYPISADTKVVSKILELHLFPHFLSFAEQTGFDIELAAHQNWYPDLTFVSKKNPAIKFAGDKEGSGNTGNIGSIKSITDILSGRGVFSNAGEKFFDDYWMNFGKITVTDDKGGFKKISTFAEYLRYRGLPETLDCPRRSKKAGTTYG